jgi:hypothetical protein
VQSTSDDLVIPEKARTGGQINNQFFETAPMMQPDGFVLTLLTGAMIEITASLTAAATRILRIGKQFLTPFD